MAKILNINLDKGEDELKLFGINSILKDYQMSALINQELGLDLSLNAYDGVFKDYSVFSSNSGVASVALLQNLNLQNEYAFEKLKSFEYLILISGGEELNVIKGLKNKPDIIYLSKIETSVLPKREERLLKQLLA